MNETSYVFRAGASGAAARKGAGAAADAAENRAELLEELTRDMLAAADSLEFERAAYLRDRIKELKGKTATRKHANLR